MYSLTDQLQKHPLGTIKLLDWGLQDNFYVISDGSEKPYRVRVRPTSFHNLHALPFMAEGGMVADLVAIIGSLDIILGEIDR